MAMVPLVSVVLFTLAVVLSINFLRIEDMHSQLQAIERDGEYVAQRVTARVMERQENIQRLSRLVMHRQLAADEFDTLAHRASQGTPELRDITLLDSAGLVLNVHIIQPIPRSAEPQMEQPLPLADERALLHQSARRLGPTYALIKPPREAEPVLALSLPLLEQGVVTGYLFARYNLTSLLYYAVPAETFKTYAVSLLDHNLHVAAGQAFNPNQTKSPWWLLSTNAIPGGYTSTMPALDNVIALHLLPYRNDKDMAQRGMIFLVLSLSALTGWMLLANWRHLRRRQRSQQELLAETSFRRAMENSLITGMRALDRQGRISYVNAAFCQMTGWSSEELVGQNPPYSFWHPDDYPRNHDILNRTLSAHIPQGGYQMRVLRKNGTTFDARMYMAPLVTADGEQTGWIASMTDITESNRVKRQLTSAHERFTRVLDALDVAVSVAPLGSEELLFANHAYRQWYGDDDATGHMQMLMQAGRPATPVSDPAHQEDNMAGLPTAELPEAAGNNSEIHIERLGRWIEVRSRYLEWVDGRLAQMVVATDITARRVAEELSAQHEARAQAASRLVTMGEMASSVAHELNQPLTAINNYCNGMVSRVRSGQIDKEALLGALEKTSRQAQRAGQIIQRIRSFVKRSTPNYTETSAETMVLEAVELAEIEMRRRSVRLLHFVQPRLPLIMADKILIEQVLINLLKNAAESIDHSQTPAELREVRLNAHMAEHDGKQVIEFTVDDHGKGISPEVDNHLFEAFFTTKNEGLGIGLNLCRSIVESHQGRLQAQNIYNGDVVTGCRFSFWIPVPTSHHFATPTH